MCLAAWAPAAGSGVSVQGRGGHPGLACSARAPRSVFCCSTAPNSCVLLPFCPSPTFPNMYEAEVLEGENLQAPQVLPSPPMPSSC